MNARFQKTLFCLGCILCGWVSAFAMPPASVIPAVFIGLSALYWLYARTANAGGAFAAGFFFALGYFTTGLWWIGNALLVDGNEFAWVWPISVIGLPTLLALFTGTYLAISRMVAAPGTVKGFLAFAFFLTFSEWARGNAFTGFPWNLYGYAWSDVVPMIQISRWTGAYGLTLMTVVCAAAAGFLLVWKTGNKQKAILASLVILTIAGSYALGAMRLAQNPTQYDRETKIVVVQPNIPQDMKWDPVETQNNFLKTLSLSRGGTAETQAKNTFIVWPETAISPAVYTLPENIAAMANMMAAYDGTTPYLVTGILRRFEKDGANSYANSIAVFDSRLRPLATYDKTHLVPFGEFIPFQDYIPLKPVAAFKGFERGHGATILSVPGAAAFSPLICYEVIFPDNVTPRTGERPRWIVNVTNDGWYGLSAGPHQHFAQTRLRAVEEGIPVIRSANTGISGIIDAYGRVIDFANLNEEAIMVSFLPLNADLKNPFWPWIFQTLLLFLALSLQLALILRLKSK